MCAIQDKKCNVFFNINTFNLTTLSNVFQDSKNKFYEVIDRKINCNQTIWGGLACIGDFIFPFPIFCNFDIEHKEVELNFNQEMIVDAFFSPYRTTTIIITKK